MKKEIVDKYCGADTCDICMEEAGELIHALNKYKRACGIGYATQTNQSDARINLIQAIADAQNAIDSVIYALDIDKKEITKEINRADEQQVNLLGIGYEIKKKDEKQAKNEFHSEKCGIKNNDAYPETYWIEEEIGGDMLSADEDRSSENNNTHDAVNHPSHYCRDGIECIDVIKATTKGMSAFDAFCQGNAMKYLFRWQYKNGVEDLKKARWYIDKLIEIQESSVNKNKE